MSLCCGGSEVEIRVRVRVKPGTSRERVGGRYPSPDGDALVIAVTAPAVDGRANAAVVQALAKALGVRPTEVTLVHGLQGRSKTLDIPDTCSSTWSALLGS